MRRWLKIAVPLGIAAVLVTVLAIGFGSPSSDAAQCNVGTNTTGTLSGNSSATAQFLSCTDPMTITVWVFWDNNNKDLGLGVTSPTGESTYLDQHSRPSEIFPETPASGGTWTISVDNHGRGATKYSLIVAFR